MGCGCNKRKARRAQAIRVSGTGGNLTNTTPNKIVSTRELNALSNNKPEKISKLDAEKRRAMALKRNEILKKMGKM